MDKYLMSFEANNRKAIVFIRERYHKADYVWSHPYAVELYDEDGRMRMSYYQYDKQAIDAAMDYTVNSED